MSEFALALCGGGGKGAYQIGIWKALMEKNIMKDLKAVSGTSVGALNALLFALGDYDNARAIWESIDSKKMLTFNRDEIGKMLSNSGIFTGAFSKKIKEKNFFNEIYKQLTDEIEIKGIFKNEGIRELLEKIDFSPLKKSIPIFINCFNTKNKITETIQLNDLSKDLIISYLLASSAFPVAYGMIKIGGKFYQDGGFSGSYMDQILNDGILKNIYIGNVPVDILYKKGYKNILIASLNRNFSLYNLYDIDGKKINFYSRYPNGNFTVVTPQESMGSVFNLNGILDFSKDGISKKMKNGYSDALELKDNNQNDIIYKLFKEKIHNGTEMNDLINKENIGIINIPISTLGGMTWYSDIFSIDKWRVQQHKVLKFHYRILDPSNVRRAWILDPDKFIEKLKDYNV